MFDDCTPPSTIILSVLPNSRCARSSRMKSFHLFFGLPLGRLHGASNSRLHASGSPSHRNTYPNQPNLLFNTVSRVFSRLHLLRISLLDTRSLRVSPQILLSIHRSHPHSTCSSLCVSAHKSVTCSMACLTQAAYT